MVRSIALVLLAGALLPGTPARAAGLDGCRAPPAVTAATPRFYIDAARGNDASDGRAPARAWRTFAPLAAGGRQHPAIGGDALVLVAGGNYGKVALWGIRPGATGWLRIAAAPGQAPVLAGLGIGNAERIAVSGLRIVAQGDGRNPLTLVRIDGTATAPVRDIRFTGNVVFSTGSTAGWSQKDWQTRAARVGIGVAQAAPGAATCIQIARNRLRNIGVGVSILADRSEVADNDIDGFAVDGFDFAGDGLLISGNRLVNAIASGLPFHSDFMQGFPARWDRALGADGKPVPGSVTTFHDVWIVGNTMIRQTDPTLAFTGAVQGIDGFAGNWERLVVANNLLVLGGPRAIARKTFYNETGKGDFTRSLYVPCRSGTQFRSAPADPAVDDGDVHTVAPERLGWVSACVYHGISFASVRHGVIVNNTVVSDNPAAELVGINVPLASTTGDAGCGTLIANNIAQMVSFPKGMDATLAPGWPTRDDCAPGRPRNHAVGNVSLRDPRWRGVGAGFVRYDPGAALPAVGADLRPRRDSAMASTGLPLPAGIAAIVARDIAGRPRPAGEVGAIAY